MITTKTTTTKKISTLGHERERETDRDTAATLLCQCKSPRQCGTQCIGVLLHGRVLVRSAAAEWDTAHVLCATPDALNVVSLLYFLPLRDIRRSVCMYVAVD
jgi:hypothetical protein